MSDTPQRDEHGRLLPGHTANPAGRPPGRSSALAAFRDFCSPHWPAIQTKLIEKAKSGDLAAIEIVASRMVAAPKGTGEIVHIPGLREATTLEEKGDCIVNAVGDGLLSIEGGRAALGMLRDLAQAKGIERDIAKIERRLHRIEKLQGIEEPKRIAAKVTKPEPEDDGSSLV